MPTQLLLIATLLGPAARADVVVTTHRVGNRPVVVVQPKEGPGPWPVVYALPGLGEMVRSPEISASAWVNEYGLKAAFAAVQRGDLTKADFQGLVTDAQLAEYRLAAAQFRGLVIVCPATPKRMDKAWKAWLIDQVIPWAERTLPVIAGPKSRGLDGISMGGRHTLKLGFERPELFKTLGTEQAAVRGLGPRLQKQVRARPDAYRHLHINLLTSTKDGFRAAITRFHQRLSGLNLTVRHTITPGRHDKRFVRGPGAIDMLLFHDRVLWSRQPRSRQPK